MRRLVAGLLVLLGLTFAGAALGQPTAPALDAAKIRAQLLDLEHHIASATNSDALPPLRAQALALQALGDKVAAQGQSDLAVVDARLAQLGPPPTAPGGEEPSIARVRRDLAARRASIDGNVKGGRLLSVAAAQAVDDVAERERELFNARTFRRGYSPLTPAFWTDLASSLPPDLARVGHAAVEAADAARTAREPRAALILAAGAGAALLLLWPVGLFFAAWARRRVIADIPPTSLRRSAFAVGNLVIDVVVPVAAAAAMAVAAKWSGVLSGRAASLADSLVFAVAWGAVVVGVGRALLRPEAPSWRIAPVSDATARRLAALPYAVALVTMAGLMVLRLNSVVGASLAATVAAHCAIGVAYSLMAAAALVLLGVSRSRPPRGDEAGGNGGPRPTAGAERRSSGWSLVAVAVAAAIAVSLTATLLGYAVFGAMVAGQIYWIGLIAGLAYLLLTFVDDLCDAAFSGGGWAERSLVVVFDLRRSTVEQLGVLTSAAVRLLLLAMFLTLALSPFGRGANTTWSQLLSAGRTLRVGTLVISPGAVLGGLLSLVIGVALVRGLQRWLDKRYLPATGWDVGVKNSISTAVGYLGMGAAIFWALASAGLGLDKVALIASALSVGIGFGLQQIVQNFVSGLILLAERPVKVGDWVNVSGVEGDVRHIRVRATEIQLLDRSTVLVPNSELVTKAVQNKTLHAPRGRAEVLVAIGDPTRAAQARQLILETFDRHDDVLCDPEPKVFIDAVTNGAVTFRCFAYVDGPRDAYGVRSQLYFDVLAAFAKAGIALAGASQSLVVEPGEAFREALAARSASAEPAAARRPKRSGSDPSVPPGGPAA